MQAIAADHATQTLILLSVTAWVAGMARGFSGFGAALIFMPVASALAGPKLAAPVLMVSDAVVTMPLVRNAWDRAHKRDVLLMLLGALAGVPVGTYVLTAVDPGILCWMIVALVAVMLVLLMSGWRYQTNPADAVTAGVGAISGLFTGVAQVGGPPVVAYWLGGNRNAASMRANIIVFFAGTNVLTATTYVYGGLLTREALWLAAVAGPAYGVGLLLGSRMFGLASEATFRRVCFALIALAVLISLPWPL